MFAHLWIPFNHLPKLYLYTQKTRHKCMINLVFYFTVLVCSYVFGWFLSLCHRLFRQELVVPRPVSFFYIYVCNDGCNCVARRQLFHQNCTLSAQPKPADTHVHTLFCWWGKFRSAHLKSCVKMNPVKV